MNLRVSVGLLLADVSAFCIREALTVVVGHMHAQISVIAEVKVD